MTQANQNKQKRLIKVLALPEADPTLKAAEVLRTWSMVPELTRKVEQAGKGYAKMQYDREFGIEENTPILEEEKEKKSDGGEDEEGDHEYQRKKPKRTKEQID